MLLNNKTYDFFKWLVTIALPAFGSFYFALSKMWELPYVENVVGTVTITSIFFGALIGISSSNYKKENPEGATPEPDGEIVVDKTDPDKDVYSMNLGISLEELMERDYVTFAVSDMLKRGIRD